MRTDDGWIIDPDDITVGLAGEPMHAWLIRENGSTFTQELSDVTRYTAPGVWPRYLCRCEQVRRMVESVDSHYGHAAHLFNHRLAAEGLIPHSAIDVLPPEDETPRMAAVRFARDLVKKLQRSTTPDIAFDPTGLLEAALAAPSAMILTDSTGQLTVDDTDDDIMQYQQPDVWPRYVCRVATLQSMLGRTTPDKTAEMLSGMFAQSLALDQRQGPHMPANPDPAIVADPDAFA